MKEVDGIMQPPLEAALLISPKFLVFAGAKFSLRGIDLGGSTKMILLLYFSIFFFFVFLGLPTQHMEVPRLGVELEL